MSKSFEQICIYPLLPEVHRFPSRYFGSLSKMHSPYVIESRRSMLIICSDQCATPEDLSFADPDQFLIIQNLASSVIAPDREGDLGILGSLELAIHQMNVQDVVVCGHTECSIIRGWIDPEQNSRKLLSNHMGDVTLEFINDTYPADIPQEERFGLVVREHLLLQVEHLIANDFIRERLDRGDLRLQAWLLDDRTGRIRAFAPSLCDFVPIEEII